jgi:hypothetical protein
LSTTMLFLDNNKKTSRTFVTRGHVNLELLYYFMRSHHLHLTSC